MLKYFEDGFVVITTQFSTIMVLLRHCRSSFIKIGPSPKLRKDITIPQSRKPCKAQGSFKTCNSKINSPVKNIVYLIEKLLVKLPLSHAQRPD
jgi:L-2-hydroxyglutarate oxidase LhgO